MNPNIIWSPGVPLEAMIKQAVEAAMVHYRGNKSAVARSLGISIRTLDTRLEKYGKDKEQHEQRISDADAKRAEFLKRQRGNTPGAGFDTAATPSIHTAEVKRRQDALRAKPSAGVPMEPAPVASAK